MTKKEKLIKAVEDGLITDDSSLSVFEMIDELKEELGELKQEQNNTKPYLDSILEQVKKNELVDFELTPELISKLKGDSYVLTDEDKKQIADSIPVPVIEKIIERIETIRELPKQEIIQEIDTEDIIEDTAKKVLDSIVIPEEDGESIIEKINLNTDKKIKKEKVEGFNELENIVKQNANVPKGVWQGTSEVRVKELIAQSVPNFTETDTLQSVTDRGSTTTNTINVGGLKVGGVNIDQTYVKNTGNAFDVDLGTHTLTAEQFKSAGDVAIVYTGDFVDTVTIGSRVITFTNDGTDYTSWADAANTWTPTYTGGKLTAVTTT